MSPQQTTSSNPKTLATASGQVAAPPSLLNQVGMAGSAAVITVTFIHPIDVVKVRLSKDQRRSHATRNDVPRVPST